MSLLAVPNILSAVSVPLHSPPEHLTVSASAVPVARSITATITTSRKIVRFILSRVPFSPPGSTHLHGLPLSRRPGLPGYCTVVISEWVTFDCYSALVANMVAEYGRVGRH